jgi:hypothetical protein
MPFYCYAAEDDSYTLERFYPMGKAPKIVEIEGVRLHRDIAAEHSGTAAGPGIWPMKSEAAGVAPTQAAEAQAQSHKFGVPTEFTRDGRAVFTSARHRKAYCEQVGLYDRHGGPTDPRRLHRVPDSDSDVGDS